jgi:hypothetical protein
MGAGMGTGMGMGMGMGMVALSPSHGVAGRAEDEGKASTTTAAGRARLASGAWHLAPTWRLAGTATTRHANTKQLRRLLHGIGLLGSENEGGAAPEKTVTSLGRKGVLDLAKVNARLG